MYVIHWLDAQMDAQLVGLLQNICETHTAYTTEWNEIWYALVSG